MAFFGKVDPAPWREGEQGGSTSGFSQRPNLGDEGEQTEIKNCGTCGSQYTGSSCSHPTRSTTQRTTQRTRRR